MWCLRCVIAEMSPGVSDKVNRTISVKSPLFRALYFSSRMVRVSWRLALQERSLACSFYAHTGHCCRYSLVREVEFSLENKPVNCPSLIQYNF